MPAVVKQGDLAPDFELPDQHGNPVKLSELRGKTVVLYFYPKADTPGCTTQACGVRDHRADYEPRTRSCWGLAGPGHEGREVRRQVRARIPAARRRGPRGRRGLRRVGREVDVRAQVHGQRATTFVIGPDGEIRGVPDVKPAEHDELVLRGCRSPETGMSAWIIRRRGRRNHARLRTHTAP